VLRDARSTLAFTAAVCVACGLLVSLAAVGLRDRHEANAELERRRNVVRAAGLVPAGRALDGATVERVFARVRPVVVHLPSGERRPEVDPGRVRGPLEPASGSGREAPPNEGGLRRLPELVVVHEVRDDEGRLELVVLPVEGLGLWSTLRGYLALSGDGRTVRGLSFHEHGETPGLGGKVDSPEWRALWEGRSAFDDQGRVALEVVKVSVGAPSEDPHRVDGISGATITSRAVSELVRFWLGEAGFGAYLARLRSEGGSP
jgi:Na+-transporting NADH:ubiquinone oxidoreductase subunit C